MAKVRNACIRSACVLCCGSVACRGLRVSCDLSQISAVECLDSPDIVTVSSSSRCDERIMVSIALQQRLLLSYHRDELLMGLELTSKLPARKHTG